MTSFWIEVSILFIINILIYLIGYVRGYEACRSNVTRYLNEYWGEEDD